MTSGGRTESTGEDRCYGKTPMQTFLDSVFLEREKMLDANFSSAPEPERSPAEAGARPRVWPLELNQNVRSSLSYSIKLQGHILLQPLFATRPAPSRSVTS